MCHYIENYLMIIDNDCYGISDKLILLGYLKIPRNCKCFVKM